MSGQPNYTALFNDPSALANALSNGVTGGAEMPTIQSHTLGNPASYAPHPPASTPPPSSAPPTMPPSSTASTPSSAAPGEPSSTTTTPTPESQEKPPSGGKYASVSLDEYNELLNFKSKLQAEQEKIKEIEQKHAQTQKELESWRAAASDMTGGQGDPAQVKKAFEEVRKLQVDNVKKMTDEFWPDFEKAYNSADTTKRPTLKLYYDALKQFREGDTEGITPRDIKAVEGIATILSQASQQYNTDFARKEAEIRALQERTRIAEEAKKEADRLAEMYKSGHSRPPPSRDHVDPTYNHYQQQQPPPPLPSTTNTLSTEASGKPIWFEQKLGGSKRKNLDGLMSDYFFSNNAGDTGTVDTVASGAPPMRDVITEPSYPPRFIPTKKRAVRGPDGLKTDVEFREWDPNLDAFTSRGYGRTIYDGIIGASLRGETDILEMPVSRLIDTKSGTIEDESGGRVGLALTKAAQMWPEQFGNLDAPY
jgi:hypothetical protein